MIDFLWIDPIIHTNLIVQKDLFLVLFEEGDFSNTPVPIVSSRATRIVSCEEVWICENLAVIDVEWEIARPAEKMLKKN